MPGRAHEFAERLADLAVVLDDREIGIYLDLARSPVIFLIRLP
jgi:hypothetical protein